MKYYFHKNLGMLDNINEIMTGMSHHNIYLRVVWAIILVGLPVTTIVLNMLAILHVQHNKPANEIVISLRLRMFNILLTLLSGIVIMVFLAYAIALSYQTK
jgi:hypothetical protein